MTTDTAIRHDDSMPRLLARLACCDDCQLAGLADAIDRTLARRAHGEVSAVPTPEPASEPTTAVILARFRATDRDHRRVLVRRDPAGGFEYLHPDRGEWYTLPAEFHAKAEEALRQAAGDPQPTHRYVLTATVDDLGGLLLAPLPIGEFPTLAEAEAACRDAVIPGVRGPGCLAIVEKGGEPS